MEREEQKRTPEIPQPTIEEDLANQISGMQISQKTEVQCPICDRILKLSKGIYTCRPHCYMGRYPGPGEYVEYVKKRLYELQKEHMYCFQKKM